MRSEPSCHPGHNLQRNFLCAAMWFLCLHCCKRLLVHVGAFGLFKIAKAAKELLHFRSSHFRSTQWRCVDFASFRNVYELQILPPKFWTICLWLSQLTILMSENNAFKLTHLTELIVHRLAEQHANPCCWLMTVRATLFCFSTPLSKRFRASLDLGQGYNPHGQSHAAGTKKHFDWKRNICEMTFMKSHVAIICRQSLKT